MCTPPDYQGKRIEPSFTGILQAYYGAGLGDWSVVWERRAQPGTRCWSTRACTSRAPELRRSDDDALRWIAVADTQGNSRKSPSRSRLRATARLFSMATGITACSMSWRRSITSLTASPFATLMSRFSQARRRSRAPLRLTVKNCRFENVGFGVWTEYAGSSDFYIADNLFLGREDRMRLIGWTGPLWASAGAYGSHELRSYYAVKVYGPGHVIAHNAIAYFHDGIGISTYGTPEKDPERRASSIDIYNNDIHLFNDDFIETDGGVHNIRVFNNRGVNAAQGGYSSQPVFGGPVYFFRNILYHVPSGVAFKFSAKPAGLFVFHNTIIGEQVARDPSSNVHWRNNLFLGRDTPDRGIMTWANATDTYSSDYNGFRPNKGVAAQYALAGPAKGQRSYEPKPDGLENLRRLGRPACSDGSRGARPRGRFRHLREDGPRRPVQAPSRVSRDGPQLPVEAGK